MAEMVASLSSSMLYMRFLSLGMVRLQVNGCLGEDVMSLYDPLDGGWPGFLVTATIVVFMFDVDVFSPWFRIQHAGAEALDLLGVSLNKFLVVECLHRFSYCKW